MSPYALMFCGLLASQAFGALAAGSTMRSTRVAPDGSVESLTDDNEPPASATASSVMDMTVDSQGQVEAAHRTHSHTDMAHNLLRETEALTHSGVKADPEKINSIDTIVNDELLPVLLETVEARQKETDADIAAIKKCNAGAVKQLSNIASTIQGKVHKVSLEHTSCRTDEEVYLENEKQKCQQLTNFVKSIVAPAELPDNKNEEAVVDYVRTMAKYFCPKEKEAEAKEDECKKAKDEHQEVAKTCDKLQATFESGFCTWRTKLVDTCNEETTCYDAAKKKYEDHKTETEKLVDKWKTEYVALKKISCFVQVWLSDDNANTVDEAKIQECKNLESNSDKVSINYGKVPDKAQCSSAATKVFPGSPSFKNTEYKKFLALVSEPNACLDMPVAEYVEGQGGQSQCPVGYTLLTDKEQCLSSQTAAAVGATNGVGTSGAWWCTTGCFHGTDTLRVYWNTHSVGSCSSMYRPVCVKSQDTYVATFSENDMNDWNCGAIQTCGDLGAICGGYKQKGKDSSIERSVNLAAGTYKLALDFIKVDSWDGEEGEVYVNGKKCWSSGPLKYSQGAQKCGSQNDQWKEEKLPVECKDIGVNEGEPLKIKVTSTLDQTSGDESFGISNVKISSQVD